MIYIVEESMDFDGNKGYQAIYASNTLQGAQFAVEKFIKNDKDEKLYDYGFDDENKIWWYSTNHHNFQIITLPLNN